MDGNTILLIGALLGAAAFIVLAGPAGPLAGGLLATVFYGALGAAVGAAIAGVGLYAFSGGGSGTADSDSGLAFGNQYVLKLDYSPTDEKLLMDLQYQGVTRYDAGYSTKKNQGWIGELVDDVEKGLDYGAEDAAGIRIESTSQVPKMYQKYIQNGLMVNSKIYIQQTDDR